MFEDKDIDNIIRSQTPRRHRYYFETVEHAKEMGVHVEGKNPATLLKEKRPNEPEDIRRYREKVWKPVTKSMAGKIINTVAKIFDPKLYRVDFPEKPNIVKPEDELGKYLTEDFGIWKSIWVFVRETLLVKEFSDPNSVLLMIPENPEAQGNETYKPVPLIFKSEYVVEFEDGEFYIIWIPGLPESKRKEEKLGKLWLITTESIQLWVVKNNDHNNKKLVLEIPTGFMPAFRLGGTVMGDREPYWYESFIAGIQPHWDKVVTMVSDLDGSTVNHLFPSMWEWQVECGACNGTKTIEVPDEGGAKPIKVVTCETCEGTGMVTNKTPFGIHTVKRDAIDPALPNPTPPAGFITKDITPLVELKKSIEEQILAGYSSVNMEVLHRVGENQSGIAKTIDRSDLDSFLMRIAQHVFDCNIQPIIELTAKWMYGEILSEQQLNEFLEGITISKPKEFSVVGSNMLMDELKAATASGVSDNYLRQIETELSNNRFSNNEPLRKRNLAIINLKPFPSKSDDEIALQVASGIIPKRDAIRNTYIDQLVDMAIENSDDFLDMDFSEQIGVLNGLIDESFGDGLPDMVAAEAADEGLTDSFDEEEEAEEVENG